MNLWPSIGGKMFVEKNSIFGAVSYNPDPDTHKCSGYGIGFDA